MKTSKTSSSRIRKADLKHRLRFDAFGVAIEIASNEAGALDAVRALLDREFSGRIPALPYNAGTDHRFDLIRNRSAKDTVRKNDRTVSSRIGRESALKVLISEIRITVAEYSPRFVFVHAAVVCVGERALLLPGKSLSGKTTLAAALVRAGAAYCSDEFAVIGVNGDVIRFPRPLSFRDPVDRFTRMDRDHAEIGGQLGPESSKLAGVIITEFLEGETFRPTMVSRGEGLLELIKNTVPMRRNPGFALEVLARASEKAVFLRSKRGDAAETARTILSWFSESKGA